ncbi:hypothetical protein N0V93_006212 [Gnomoniopsis smithogilvyi]|uniref:Epoxide hydrolase N-terminal domain-containing protein n=1 Tax=Gnomoniopsis smithogilvyi TaxID=1191159 RepID=A0A9W8YMU3_9PEZI|nr:hypothetical protein N0V93_006212 [Gnomoniopsis smithogilvyi]
MASFQGFDIIPSGAKGTAEPFQLHVSDTELSDFKTLLKLSPIAPETWENKTSTRDGGKYFGITRDWLINAKETWLEKFDWREQEAYLNSFPNFKIPIKDGNNEPLSIHFAALFSKKKDATPVIFQHGWPGSHMEFLPMLDLLRTKYTAETLPFHAIVPSLPGYTLSSGPPTGQDFTSVDAARVLNQMMIDLGFGAGYIAQGGDVGYYLSRQMSVLHDECKALHVNFLGAGADVDVNDLEGVDERELQQLEGIKQWRKVGMAYAMEHATRPSTIGLVLSSSPLALLAWIGEKHLEWSDADLIPLDKILSMVTLYWFTSSLPRCIWPYRDLILNEQCPISKTKPLGYSEFKDLSIIPKAWSKYYPNMKFRKTHEKGGHFAALEQPQAFLEDIEEFVLNVVGPLS